MNALCTNGHMIVSGCSSGAIGRLAPEDVVGLICYLRDQASG